MAEEITNATQMADGEELRSTTKKRFFDVSFKLKVLSRPFLIIPHVQRERGKVIGRGVHIYIFIYIYVCGRKKI